jgi:hypothetical protein
VAQGDDKLEAVEAAVAAVGNGSPAGEGAAPAAPLPRSTPEYRGNEPVRAKAAADALRGSSENSRGLDAARRNGSIQALADGTYVNTSTLALEQQRFNVGGGALLTYGDILNGYLADPNSPESDNLVSSLVSGRFLDPDKTTDGSAIESALSDAVRVRSAQVAGLSPSGGVIGDFWSTTSSYRGYTEDRFAGAAGAYSGPVSTVTEMNVEDLKNIANQTAGMLVGRAVSDDEFEKMLKKVRKAEKKDPRITDSSVDGKNSVKEGISAAGRQNIIRDALINTDEADGVIKATTMMGNFDTWLRSKNG